MNMFTYLSICFVSDKSKMYYYSGRLTSLYVFSLYSILARHVHVNSVFKVREKTDTISR